MALATGVQTCALPILADWARRITAAQLLSLQLGRLKDAGKMQPTQVSLAKWNNCRMAIDIAREARDLLGGAGITTEHRSEEHTSELQSLMRISYAVFCLKKKKTTQIHTKNKQKN